MFDQLLRWLQPARHRALPVHHHRPQAEGDEEPVRGCGWFDSSHDLEHGAHVIELADDVTPLWLPLCRKGTLAQA